MKRLLILSALFAMLPIAAFAQAPTITSQPAATTIAFTGFINVSLSVGTSAAEGQIHSYQWFSNTVNSNIGGTPIDGATSARFTVPTNLTLGEHFFFSEVRSTDGAIVRSNVAVVRVFDFDECDLC